MKIFLILLSTLKVLCASINDEQQLDRLSLVATHHLTVANPRKPLSHFPGMEGISVLLVPMNPYFARGTLQAYNDPVKMLSPLTGEIVQNPFSLSNLSSPYVLCLLSRSGIIGHFSLEPSSDRETIFINMIGYTEATRHTKLMHTAVKTLVNNPGSKKQRWSTRISPDNLYLKEVLKFAGFEETSSTRFTSTYIRSSSIKPKPRRP